MLNFIKEKSYYLLGAIVLIIIILAVVSSCSSSKRTSYDAIEEKMVIAAKKYYSKFPERLPNLENEKVSVDINSLVESELMDQIKDPNNKNEYCNGYVDVTKAGNEYQYVPILNCSKYETELLSNVIKNSKKDEYGNGVYEIGGEYIYKGDDVKNYIVFSNIMWRIVKLDSDGELKLLYFGEKNLPSYIWDSDYNSEVERTYGDTTDYLQTDMRKTLVNFYENNIIETSKKYVSSKDICIGGKYAGKEITKEEECSVVKEKEKVSLLQVSDYETASLDDGCVRYNSPECVNRNYLVNDKINTWLQTRVLDNTYEMYTFDGVINRKRASRTNKINPVIYLRSNAVKLSGDGTYNNPYRVK